MPQGADGARVSYLTLPRLGSYRRSPCQLWHVQQYSFVAFVSVMSFLLCRVYKPIRNSRANDKRPRNARFLDLSQFRILSDGQIVNVHSREAQRCHRQDKPVNDGAALGRSLRLPIKRPTDPLYQTLGLQAPRIQPPPSQRSWRSPTISHLLPRPLRH